MYVLSARPVARMILLCAHGSASRIPQVDLIVMPGPAEVQRPAPWSRKINGRRARASGQYPASDDVRAIERCPDGHRCQRHDGQREPGYPENLVVLLALARRSVQ